MVNISKLIPNKRLYRSRAHINPLNMPNFPYPHNYHYINWSQYFPKI